MSQNVWRTVNRIVMQVVGAVMVLPLFLMLLTSMKPEAEVLNPENVVPRVWTVANYLQVIGWAEEAPFGRWFSNSVFVSSAVTLGVILFSAMGAFAIKRLKVPGGQAFLAIIIASMMVPGQLFLVPLYLILSKLHWLDTPAALIVPATAGGFGIYMLSQFMEDMPLAIEEAALLDGCSPAQLFVHQTLPLCAPAISTLAVFTFIGSWNDFMGPLVFMDSVRNYTLPVGIALYQTSYYTEYGLTLATSVLAIAPLLFIFAIFQRQIVSSMAASGLKD
ncbi:MAG: carbohydrate ABC transporter permease [Fimbriimonas sp.]